MRRCETEGEPFQAVNGRRSVCCPVVIEYTKICPSGSVSATCRLSGDKDYLLKVVADDIPGYDAFVCEKLARLRKVGKFSSMFVLSTVKHQTKIELT